MNSIASPLLTAMIAGIVLVSASTASAWWDDDYYDRPWGGGPWYGGYPGYGWGGHPGYGWGNTPSIIYLNPPASGNNDKGRSRVPR